MAGVVLAEAPLSSLRPMPRPGSGAAAAAPGALSEVAFTAAPAPGPKAASAEDIIARAGLGGALGYALADARTGLVLESLAGETPLAPASVAKTITAQYALEALGADFRFTTRFIATGPLGADGRLAGDLVLAGSGDPLTDTDTLVALIGRLKAAGLKRVDGRFLVYGGALPYVRAIDPAQPEHVGYNPPVAGLNLNFNRVHFAWAKAQVGWTVAMDARSETLQPKVSMATMRVVERDLPTYTYAEIEGRDEWTVASGALGNAGSRWLPVRRPERYIGEVVGVLARAQGIELPEAVAVDTLPEGRELALHLSPPLETMLRDMLKYSTNLVAEALGLAASRKRGVAVTGLAESARAMSAWMAERFGARSAELRDHSGLGGDSRISAGDLVRMLVALGPTCQLHGLLKEIGAETDAGEVDPAARHVIRAKTGTLNFVSTLAGWVVAPDGTPLAFAVLAGDLARRAAVAPEEVERPPGGRDWAARARLLQQQLINRWVAVYGA